MVVILTPIVLIVVGIPGNRLWVVEKTESRSPDRELMFPSQS